MLTAKTVRDLMDLGKWDEARQHLEEVLHGALDASSDPNYYVRFAAHALAWLETDPARAAHYRERLRREHPLTEQTYERHREDRMANGDAVTRHWVNTFFFLPDL